MTYQIGDRVRYQPGMDETLVGLWFDRSEQYDSVIVELPTSGMPTYGLAAVGVEDRWYATASHLRPAGQAEGAAWPRTCQDCGRDPEAMEEHRPGCIYSTPVVGPPLHEPAPRDADNVPSDRLTGFSMWFDREQWGVVIDALIQHRGHADSRRAVNSESTSDVRADMCVDLIGQLNAAARLLHEPTDRDADNVPSEALRLDLERSGREQIAAEWRRNASPSERLAAMVQRDPANAIPVQSIEGSPSMPPEFWQHVHVGVPIDVSPGAFIRVDDADNVPSDWVRAYAEAIDQRVCDHPNEPGMVCDQPYCIARAVMAVTDRKQATLLTENARLRRERDDAREDYHEAVVNFGNASATIARVEALHTQLGARCHYDGEMWPCLTIAALRGPDPTEED